MHTIAEIADVLNAPSLLPEPHTAIEHLLTDSRRLVISTATLFFALETPRRSGASFIGELYEMGVRNFVVKHPFDSAAYATANFIYVDDPLKGLQTLASHHRLQFSYPVIGITGSNGKTVVKEWLHQLLHADLSIVRSPKSFNSQVGVPLSVWNMNEHHQLAIFEAGISQKHEMQKLQQVIHPTIGILTNIGEAHNTSFANKEEKLREKLLLFSEASLIIYHEDDPLVATTMASSFAKENLFTWGFAAKDLKISSIQKSASSTTIYAEYQGRQRKISIPFTDNASIENATTCWCVLLYFKVDDELINKRMQLLQPVEMRLQLKHGINNCSIINDSYSNDLSSLNIALEFLQQQAGKQSSTVILSDFGDTSNAATQYAKVAAALLHHRINKFIGIGTELYGYQSLFQAVPNTLFFKTVAAFRQQVSFSKFRDELILLKGARVFEFEQIGALFEQQVHQTVMEVNLAAMVHNLKAYHQYLQPTTKVMAMVKAFSYGSGSAEVASVLQFHKVDYLAVAYADEGVELRKAGIHMPIMVMNPDELTFPSLLEHNLEPEIYSISLLHAFSAYAETEGIDQCGIHLKLDTGMHRLGFEATDVPALISFITQHKRLVVKSVFTHLVASEDPMHDHFTLQQSDKFNEWTEAIEKGIGYTFIRHASNSAAIFRHPSLQYDMVRLGIGLYGVDSTAENILPLEPVATLRTTISQIRKVPVGETVGYNRRGVLTHDSLIATIRIGYADGFRRSLGNGVGRVCINGSLAPVVGNVCMDMTMIDVTNIAGVQEGDSVEIFGSALPVQQLAAWSQTIPYEIMTGISHRVKRVYYEG
jgi:Alr-MurF fusion protein